MIDGSHNQDIQPAATGTRQIPIEGMIQQSHHDFVVHPPMTPEITNPSANTTHLLTQNDQLMQMHTQRLAEMLRARSDIDESNVEAIQRSNHNVQNMETRIERLRMARDTLNQQPSDAVDDTAQGQEGEETATATATTTTTTTRPPTVAIENEPQTPPLPQQPQRPQLPVITLQGQLSHLNGSQQRFRTIEVTHGVTNVRMNINGTDHQFVTRRNSQRQQVQNTIPRVSLPPLEPQLIHFSQSTANNDASAEQQRFKCTLCDEFMQDPATCGECSIRYCYQCIFKAISVRPVGQKKCPYCRCQLFSEGIQRDAALCHEIQQAPRINCANEGCNAVLQLIHVQGHEAQCGFVRLRCRFVNFGCTWTGLRNSLRLHEDICDVAKVSKLVDLFRQSHADHQHIIDHLQQRLSGTTAMVELHSRLFGRFHPHPTNLLDLLDIVYTATCTPAVLLFTKDVWRMFSSGDQGRAAVSNFLYLLPTFVLITRCSAICYRLFLAVGAVKDDWVPVEQVLIFLSILLLGVLIVLCFFLDNTSCTTFSKYTLQQVERKFLEDFAALAVCAVVYVMMGFDATLIKAGTVWILMCISTCFFPAIVNTILCRMSGVADADIGIGIEKILVTGRAAAVVIFGLRYGLLVNILGLFPVLDSFFIWQLAMRQFCLPVAWNMTMSCELLLSEIPLDFQLFYVGTRSAVKVLELAVDKSSALDTVLALILLPMLNQLVYQLTFRGVDMGNKLFQSAQTELLPNQLGVRNAYNGMGVACCALWMLQLCGIALSY